MENKDLITILDNLASSLQQSGSLQQVYLDSLQETDYSWDTLLTEIIKPLHSKDLEFIFYLGNTMNVHRMLVYAPNGVSLLWRRNGLIYRAGWLPRILNIAVMQETILSMGTLWG